MWHPLSSVHYVHQNPGGPSFPARSTSGHFAVGSDTHPLHLPTSPRSVTLIPGRINPPCHSDPGSDVAASRHAQRRFVGGRVVMGTAANNYYDVTNQA